MYIYANLHNVPSKDIIIRQVHPILSSHQRRFKNKMCGDISSPGISCGWLLLLLLNLRDAITMNMHTIEAIHVFDHHTNKYRLGNSYPRWE
jgi:hypothetical protein